MKILNLQLPAFGCFTRQELDFTADGGKLHLIFGLNEAGKSTCLRALNGLLFGIPAQSRDNFKHEFKQLRVAAELARADGSRRVFVRRKGNRDTLLNPDETPAPEKELAGFLGGIGEEAFNALFCLNHELLVRGGEELLAGRGEVAESLFQAGAGVMGLRRVLEELEAEAETWYKPRGSTSVVNLAKSDFEEAKKKIRELSMAPAEWKQQAQALADRESDLRTLLEELRRAQKEKSRLERCQLALPKCLQRRQLLEELARLGAVAPLPESARDEREKALREKSEAGTRGLRARALLEQLNRQLDDLPVSAELIAQAGVVNGLLQRMDGYRNALRDLPDIRAKRERAETEAREILAEIEPGLPLERADSLRLADLRRQRIQHLAGEHAALQERQKQAEKQVLSLRAELEAANRERADAVPLPDTDEIESRMENARKLGDIEGRIREDTRTLRGLEQQAEIELKKLGLWTGSLMELERHAFPSLETVERFEAAFNALQNDQTRCSSLSRELGRETAGVERELEALRLGGEVPTEENLRLARERREQGWRLVRQSWLDKNSDPESEKTFDATRPLPAAYEQSVADADTIADRLRREAERSARLAKLTASRHDCVRRQEELAGEQARREKALADWRQDWLALWQKSGIVPLPPKEMRLWLGHQAVLARPAAEIRTRRENLASWRETLAAHASAIGDALSRLGQSIGSEPESLSDRLRRASSTLRKIEDARHRGDDQEKTLKKVEKSLQNAENEQRQVELSLKTWRQQWDEALLDLPLAGKLKPGEISLFLEKLTRLFGALRERDHLQTRTGEMADYIARFERDAAALAQTLAPDLAELAAELAVAQLQARLAQTLDRQTRRRELEKRVLDETKILTDAENEAACAESQIQILMSRAKCGTLPGLEAAEQRAETARRLAAQLEQNTADLAGFTAGAPLDQFLREIAALNADELPGRAGELAQKLAELEAQRSALEQQTAVAREKLRAGDGGAAAALAAETAQSKLAVIREGAEQYLRLKLAAEVLRRQMERYREQNQDPIVRRAGELFPRLTSGSFVRLKIGFNDKDKPILLGVRADGNEVDVAGMSDGTRDQLFLSLRLAGLEKQLDTAEPLPFIVDDILINFDDRRARATLEALAELSHRTQVLFFTHHERLVELARDTVGADVLLTHRLDANPQARERRE